jgi:hypothetical protein
LGAAKLLCIYIAECVGEFVGWAERKYMGGGEKEGFEENIAGDMMMMVMVEIKGGMWQLFSLQNEVYFHPFVICVRSFFSFFAFAEPRVVVDAGCKLVGLADEEGETTSRAIRVKGRGTWQSSGLN